MARLQGKNKGEGEEEEVHVVDLPGIYSLTATSADERATLEYVLSHETELFEQ